MQEETLGRMEPGHEGDEPVRDLSFRELLALAPIAVLCVVMTGDP